MSQQRWGGGEAPAYALDEPRGRARLQKAQPRVSLPNFFSGGAGAPGVTENLPSLRGRLGIAPHIARGKAYGPVAGQWYRVVYPDGPIPNALPFVAGLARGTSIRSRGGLVLRGLRQAEFPRLTGLGYDKVDYAGKAYDYAYDKARGWLGNWGTFNALRDALIYPIAAVAWVGGWMANFLRDLLLDRFIRAYNDQMKTVQDRINGTLDAMKALRDDANVRFEQAAGAINGRIDDLLEAWGLPPGIAMVSPQLRNVADSGFEFLSQGKTTVLWVAIGDPRR